MKLKKTLTLEERRVLNLVPKHTRAKVKRLHKGLSYKDKQTHLDQIIEAFG